jgi:hypothetical protein
MAEEAYSVTGTSMISPPIQYATTSDGVRIAFMSLGSGPPVVFASNIRSVRLEADLKKSG